MWLVDRATAGPVPACIAVTTAREAGPRLEEDYSGCFDDDKKNETLGSLGREKIVGSNFISAAFKRLRFNKEVSLTTIYPIS